MIEKSPKAQADALKTMQLVYRIYCADDVWKSTYSLSQDTE
jgi:hypothetical protein